MNNYTFTREQIIDAIKHENLAGGAFVALKQGATVFDAPTKNNCKVCAVGALLNRTVQPLRIEYLRYLAEQLTKNGAIAYGQRVTHELKKKRYLNALSVKFETLVYQHTSATQRINREIGKKSIIRKKLIRWVRRNIPKQFTVKLRF